MYEWFYYYLSQNQKLCDFWGSNQFLGCSLRFFKIFIFFRFFLRKPTHIQIIPVHVCSKHHPSTPYPYRYKLFYLLNLLRIKKRLQALFFEKNNFGIYTGFPLNFRKEILGKKQNLMKNYYKYLFARIH